MKYKPNTNSVDFCAKSDWSEVFSFWSCCILSCVLPPPAFMFLNFSSKAATLSLDLKKILIDIRNPHYTSPSTIAWLCRHLINRNTLSSLTFYNIFETEPSTHSADFRTRADLSEAFSSWSCWILSCTLPPPMFTFLNFSSNASFLSSDLQNINLHKQLLQSQSAVVCLKHKKLTLTVLADLSRTQFHLPYRVQL